MTRFSDKYILFSIKRPIPHLFQSPQNICSITEAIKIEAENRFHISKLTGNGDVFFMRSISDLSSGIDHMILAEYSEEYPPLMMQVSHAHLSFLVIYLDHYQNY